MARRTRRVSKKSLKRRGKVARKTSKKRKGSKRGGKSKSKSNNESSGGKRWIAFGTQTTFSNHKRTVEKYLNKLRQAGVKPDEIKVYQAHGAHLGYSRINIVYLASKKLIESTTFRNIKTKLQL